MSILDGLVRQHAIPAAWGCAGNTRAKIHGCAADPLARFEDDGGRGVAALDQQGVARRVTGAATIYALAQDGGEEPEIAGVYLIDMEGNPVRLGFVLGNEFSDHMMEGENYLWLAHSKLRQAALGPELLLGNLPFDVRGMRRILRGGATLWEKPFRSGEGNKFHSIANPEHHHFKNRLFRRPSVVHVHFFGTANLSFSDAVKTQEGDVFEIEADAFVLPLRNLLHYAIRERLMTVRAL